MNANAAPASRRESSAVAQYPGWCQECAGPIRNGELIRGSKEDGWRHEDCSRAWYLAEDPNEGRE